MSHLAPPATTTTKGLIKLAGHLSGTASSPTVVAASIAASEVSGANLNIEPGANPSSPNAGDLWISSNNLKFASADNVTRTLLDSDGTVAMSSVLSIGGNAITNLAEPTLSTDAATKDYVDTTTASAVEFIGGAPATSLTSSGLISGCIVTDAGSGNIDVSSGNGNFRETSSNTSTLHNLDISQVLGLAIPSNTVRWICAKYNGGIPSIIVESTDDCNNQSEWAIATVFNEAGTLHIHESGVKAYDALHSILERWHGTGHIARDEYVGGLILSESGDGNRKVLASAGRIWHRLAHTEVSAINTSVSGSFDRWYSDGVGGWTKQAAQTTWNNTQYDDGSGVLATLGANKWAAQWFYIDMDGSLISLYGTAQYNNLDSARLESPPSSAPDRIGIHGLLIGRILFEKSASLATVETAFGQYFSASSVSNHNSLSNLAWTLSGHTGTANRVAGFDSDGIAAEYTLVSGGDLGGTLSVPIVNQARGLRETTGPTNLSIGSISNGQVLIRSGTSIIGVWMALSIAITSPQPWDLPDGGSVEVGLINFSQGAIT